VRGLQTSTTPMSKKRVQVNVPELRDGARKSVQVFKFNGVNHLAMATRDMDKTIRFWRDLLGMRLVAGLGQPGYRQYFFQNLLSQDHRRGY